MLWTVNDIYEAYDDATGRLAIAFIPGGCTNYVWFVFNGTQAALIASGSCDEFDEAIANAKEAML